MVVNKLSLTALFLRAGAWYQLQADAIVCFELLADINEPVPDEKRKK
jgi:hypothetical protein